MLQYRGFMWTDRTKILIGQDGIDNLKNKKIAIIGIGGVGGYVCLMLARAGIENFTLIDFDNVDETNLNRQVVANTKSIGKNKAMVMKEMIEEINPCCNILVKDKRICRENIFDLLNEKYDYVVDAIDSVRDKVELICYCKDHNLKIISAMGAGNRIDIPTFKVMDIYKTNYDPLAKIIRKQLRERKINSLDVVISDSPAITTKNTQIGSISYYPAMCGCVISAYIINEIIKKEK